MQLDLVVTKRRFLTTNYLLVVVSLATNAINTFVLAQKQILESSISIDWFKNGCDEMEPCIDSCQRRASLLLRGRERATSNVRPTGRLI